MQDIIRTYRYPDGTLNGIAVFISTLALILLLVLGHFVIGGIKNIRGMNKVSASELTLGEIEEYITDTYLDAVDDYTKGDIPHEAAKKQILSHIAEYLDSSSAFTEDQKAEMEEIILACIQEMNLDEYQNETNKAIEEINSTFEKYVSENATTLELLKQSLQSEIDNNDTYTKEQLAILKELENSLKSTEADHYADVSRHIANTVDELNALKTDVNNNYNSFINKLYGGVSEWAANNTYKKNAYVIYNNNFYKNITGTNTATTPDQDETNWREVSIATVINYNYQTFIKTVGATEYDPSASYQAGDYVIKDGELYQATDSTSGSFDSSKWEKTSITSKLDDLRNDLDELALKSSSDLESVNDNLTDLINTNKSLTDAQREEMLKIIENNADASAEGLSNLYDELTNIITSNETSNTNEREKLLNQLDSLQNTTASQFDDYEQRIQALENKSKATTAPTVNKAGEEAEFDFGYKNGVYGYWISNTFYPF